jgi:hypothetical protein
LRRECKMDNRKIIAGFELTLMLVSLFAFSYGVALTDDAFGASMKQYEDGADERAGFFGKLVGGIIARLRAPMIPVVSAAGTGIGCCEVAVNGEICGSATAGNCEDGVGFVDGADCAATSFCKKGCCINEAAGTYVPNVKESHCDVDWVADPNCNMPAAQEACCIVGTESYYETRGACDVRGTNGAIVEWKSDMNVLECLGAAETQVTGACVTAGNSCKFGTAEECASLSGEFHPDVLCTADGLNTSCVKTEQTTCVDGKDGVYFLDSCGNAANIYDSSKVDDDSYWENVKTDGLCGDSSGSANSASCGNCDRFAGGICASASENSFTVDSGDSFCRDTSCMFDGVKYKPGESWCVYDGKIGDGDDVVGSRHWKYVCNQGDVNVEPCADYRNQICTQSNTMDIGAGEVDFRNAACVANNWRECIALNNEEGGKEVCEETLNCRIEHVDIADKFKFDICTPRYPGGSSFTDKRYQATAKSTCAMADQTCTVIYKQTMTGSCVCDTNCACEESGFAIGMNDMCRKLGDCGGEVNIAGKFTENYKVVNSPMLSADSVSTLVAMATAVPGQFAEVEDYDDYLAAAGLFGGPGPAPEDAEGPADHSNIMLGLNVGMAGILLAGFKLGWFAPATLGAPGMGAITGTGGALAGYGGMAASAIAGAIGAVVGILLAKALGLSPVGTALMSVGASMVSVALIGEYTTLVASLGGLFWPVLIIGIVLMIAALFFGMGDCDPVEVVFTCSPWQPPVGAADCELCNGDPLKPCSEYRCKSLGAACELLNKGTDNELCIDGNPNDATPPVISPQFGVISDNEVYSGDSASGVSITSVDGSNGGCIAAHTELLFGINTDEPAICTFDLAMTEFGETSETEIYKDDYYDYNHTVSFALPDPSNGESRGLNWTGDLKIYTRCHDQKGHTTPGFYTIDLCVVQGPDVTGPLVKRFVPGNDGLVSFDATSQDVEVYVNEDAVDCKWDTTDMDYSLMENDFDCSPNIAGLYGSSTKCVATMPVSGVTSDFFVRCEDQGFLDAVGRGDERNANAESFVYRLRKPEKKLEVDWIEPSQDFEVNTNFATVDFQIMTSGGGEWHHCSYSFDSFDNLADTLFQTGAERPHRWPMNWRVGDHKIYVECKDETGDTARGTTEFRIIKDSSTPQIARIWQSGGSFNIITTENAECKYDTAHCRFNWTTGQSAGTGKEHSFGVTRGETYYVKCEDEFGNVPSGCSIEARAL